MDFSRVLTNGLPFLFIVVMGANIMAMSLMNFFETDTKYTTAVYLLCAVASGALFIRSRVRFPKLTGHEHAFCLIAGLLLFAPRLAYLLEPVLGYSVSPLGDDFLHLQELVSITHTPHFPPISTFDPRKYLSYYYAPWMLGAAIYGTASNMSVKQALAITVLVYVVFATYSVIYASKILFSERTTQRVFAAVCFLYGGFDFVYWLLHFNYMPSHSEGWAQDFGFVLEYSNYFTLALWVQQHLMAAVAIFCALYVVASSKTSAAAIIAGTLFLSAVFSSTFVVIGSVPTLVWYGIRYKPLNAIPAAAATSIALSAPLWWIFLGRGSATGFRAFGELADWWIDKKEAALFVFLLIISLELIPLVMAALRYVRQRGDFGWLFIFSVLFLLSTYFVSFGVGQNYSMRGSIVPILVLSYLSVQSFIEWGKGLVPKWVALALTTYFLGGILEYTWFFAEAIKRVAGSNTELNMAVWRFNRGEATLGDLGVRQRYSAEDRNWAWYSLERKGWVKEPYPYFDRIDVEVTNVDVGYRVTASRLSKRLGGLIGGYSDNKRGQSGDVR